MWGSHLVQLPMQGYSDPQMLLPAGDFPAGSLQMQQLLQLQQQHAQLQLHPQMPPVTNSLEPLAPNSLLALAAQMPSAPQVLPSSSALTNSMELMQQMQMAELTANKQVLIQHQLEQQAATQLQMQVQLEQQAALIQWQSQALESRLSQATMAAMMMSQHVQKVPQLEQPGFQPGFQPGNFLTMAQLGQREQNEPPGLTLRMAAAGMANSHGGSHQKASDLASNVSLTDQYFLDAGQQPLMGKKASTRGIGSASVSGASQAGQKSHTKGVAKRRAEAPHDGRSDRFEDPTRADYTNTLQQLQAQVQAVDKRQDSMRGFLADLRNEDPKRVFITRRIKELGFRSKELLKQHFSKYGNVKQVLIPHTKVKPFRDALAGSAARTRPGNFGLVVMSSPQVVRRIFEEGSEHTINGVTVEVQVFELVSRPHDNMVQDETEAGKSSQEEKSTKSKSASGRSSEEKEFGESRSGGCTEEKQSSSNGTPNTGGGSNGTTKTGGETLPMSVGDWRQSRATAAAVCTGVTEVASKTGPNQAAQDGSQNTSQNLSSSSQGRSQKLGSSDSLKESSKETDTSQNLDDSSGSDPSVQQSMTLHAVMGVIGRLSSHEPIQADLADEMTQTLTELLSGPENESENCRAKLANCLRVASDRLRFEADTLQASFNALEPAALEPALPAAPAPEYQFLVPSGPGQDAGSFAAALQAEVGRLSCQTQPPPYLVPNSSHLRQFDNYDHAWCQTAGQLDNYLQAAALQSVTPPGLQRSPMNQWHYDQVPMAEPMQVAGAPPGFSDAAFDKSDDTSDAKPPPLLTLRSHLMEVRNEDHACIFVARKIHTLGFHSHKKLREHYMQYGHVVRVLVAHRKLKAAVPDSSGQVVGARTRPGSLGIILMRTPDSVQKILALGEEQIVAGHKIRVEFFEPSLALSADYCQGPSGHASTDYASTTAESSNSDRRPWSRRANPDYCNTVMQKTSPAIANTWLPIPECEAEM